MSKNVIKSDGRKEPFNTKKLIRSLERVGAGQDTISEKINISPQVEFIIKLTHF